VPVVNVDELAQDKRVEKFLESSKSIRERVCIAREIQQKEI